MHGYWISEHGLDARGRRAASGTFSSRPLSLARSGEGTRAPFGDRIATDGTEIHKPTQDGGRALRHSRMIRSATPMAATRLRPGHAWTNRARFA